MEGVRIRAAAALAAWIVAVYAVPALHLVGHGDDHVHVSGGVVYHHDAHEDLDRYFDDDFDWDDEEDAPEGARNGPSTPWSHGSGAAAHGALAALTPTPVLLPPPASPPLQGLRPEAHEARPSLAVTSPRVRGPPALAHS